MKITVWAKGRWRKVSFTIPDDLWRRIEEVSKKHGFRIEEALRVILLDGYVDEEVNDEELRRIEEEINGLEEKLYELEGHWSPLKFKTYYSAMDNQNLAIMLSGMIAENKRLRKMLGMPERDYSKVEELIHYYMSSAFGEGSGKG
ncbi:ribbon-helix-helix domain-containing protein [Thermococcus henrietii]|uniref:hypothetical protein n=1 Tax=Thermococcus henrietii TaxID=2016361 RepID=UPI000C0717F2|nr:hypothetical protein [Thermococcus henrietii]